MFSAFMTCYIIASERASGSVPRVIRVLRVPVSCLHPCFWMHVLRYPFSVRFFQLQKDRFWAWAEDTPHILRLSEPHNQAMRALLLRRHPLRCVQRGDGGKCTHISHTLSICVTPAPTTSSPFPP